jgi:hypothetical protein
MAPRFTLATLLASASTPAFAQLCDGHTNLCIDPVGAGLMVWLPVAAIAVFLLAALLRETPLPQG